MNKDYTILIIEDDIQIQRFISYALKNEGYKCICASTGHSAVSIVFSEKIDLIVLDLGLPDMDGISVLKSIRQCSEIPVIIVSARDHDTEKVSALDLGADDYLTKPFSVSELSARIRVAFRHYEKNQSDSSPVIETGGLKINIDKRLVYLNGNEIHLTPMEYSLLAFMLKNKGKVLTTKSILKEIWGKAYGDNTQVLRTLMASLRRKIEENPAKPQYIVTEIGVGYRLMDNHEKSL